MATNRSYIRRPHRTRITADQEMDLSFGAGPRGNPEPFASPEARRAAWLRHRHLLIGKLPSSPGRRPHAWWQYDSPVPWPGYEREQSTLHQADLLGDDERAALEAEWRRQFDRAWQPEFFFCGGPDDFLEGAAARRAHYRWADIPKELVKRWTAERQRAGQTIKELAESSSRLAAPVSDSDRSFVPKTART